MPIEKTPRTGQHGSALWRICAEGVRDPRSLASGYSVEIDRCDEQRWNCLVELFDDASIYQTWAYTEIVAGRGNSSRLVLLRDREIVAAAQARIVRIPLIRTAIAYVFWGPLWRRTSLPVDPLIFRNAVRALRNEFVSLRGFLLRINAGLSFDEYPECTDVLCEEGFQPQRFIHPRRSVVMDLAPPLNKLREEMGTHWKRELRVAEKKDLTVIEGQSISLFDEFIGIYKEMVARKRFVEPNNILQFRLLQQRLPDSCQMTVTLCKSGDTVCAGLVCSAIGQRALYLFGATADAGKKMRGSYLLQWRLIQWLKKTGVRLYDLNGINPARNPGTYKFKVECAGAHGKEIQYLPVVETSPAGWRAAILSLCWAIYNAFPQLQQFTAAMLRRRSNRPAPTQ
jgi:hypothetical protein